jgi:hypothetical protein
MKRSIHLVAFLLFSINLMAQKKANPFQTVKVPDSINLQLALITYKGHDDINSKTGQYIWNLQNRKDFVFKNGIYSFEGFGPHFPRRIFIFNNGKTFIFKEIGAFNPKGILSEFLKCIDALNLNNKQIVRYSKAISDYLQNEEGLTYGAEIKKN